MKQSLISILESLFHIYSPSGEEHNASLFCLRFLLGCGWKAEIDKLGNVMATRGTGKCQPLMNAHLDTVQDETDRPRLNEIQYDAGSDRFRLDGVQIGADDKAGVGMILCLAQQILPPFKILLTVGEERGQTGIRAVPAAFYDDVCWAFTLDRGNSSDVIARYRNRDMCSEAFLRKLKNIGREAGVPIEQADGRMADTYHISRHCPAVNLSCGYYGAHGKNDSLTAGETYAMMLVVKSCIENARELTGI